MTFAEFKENETRVKDDWEKLYDRIQEACSAPDFGDCEDAGKDAIRLGLEFGRDLAEVRKENRNLRHELSDISLEYRSTPRCVSCGQDEESVKRIENEFDIGMKADENGDYLWRLAVPYLTRKDKNFGDILLCAWCRGGLISVMEEKLWPRFEDMMNDEFKEAIEKLQEATALLEKRKR